MYIVIGASGYFGGYIIRSILGKTNESIIATSRTAEKVILDERIIWKKCDVQSEKSVDDLLEEVVKHHPLKIIYLAAYHHPELVEKNKRLAWDINVSSLSRFINKLPIVDKLYYVSTDCVYGNSTNNYHFKENDSLHPVNFYGHNKCAAEAIVIHSGFNVVRFPFLISPSVVKKKHFYDEIVEHLNRGETIEMFVDSYRSSLGFDRAGELLIDLMETRHNFQIVNISGDRDLSKYDVGVLIAKRENLDPNLIVPISTKQSKVWNQTKRANSTLMDNTKLKQILNLSTVDIFDRPVHIQAGRRATND